MREFIDDRHLKVRGEHVSPGILRRPFLLALVLCIVAGGLLWLDMQGVITPLRITLLQGIAPVAQPLTGIRNSAADMWDTATSVQSLRAENEALRQQQSELQAELIAREQAMVENERLRQQLAIEEEHPWHTIGAEVTIQSPDAIRRTMTIAGGSRKGIQPGMAVVGQTGSGPVALVGMVEEVGPYTSHVLLITDFSSRVSARVLHEGESALGLVQGQWQRGSRLRLEHVDREAVLSEGAVVVSAGLTGELGFALPLAAVPANLPIGAIEVVNSDGHTQFAELRPYADPDQVRYVWVILDQRN
jgi:rod shape-determining protein MreC